MNYMRSLQIGDGQISGFTLTELLVVIGIFFILSAASIPIYGNWQLAVQLDTIKAEAVQALRLARIRSAAGLNGAAHGIYFDFVNNRYILYQGNSYADRQAAYDREIVLGGAFTFSGTPTGGEVNFSPGFGVPSATGTMDIFCVASGGSTTVSVNEAGAVE